MISADIAQKVKELEIHTRRLLSGSNIGGYKSRQKGFGFEFDQLRSYQYGDDVRLIDWKSSARTPDNLLVRQYFEERNRTFMICLDLSASTYFGSGDVLKQDVMKQIAGVLSLAAEWGKDKVGLIIFSDQVEKVIPPARGQKHVQKLLTELFSYKQTGKKTDLNVLFDYVASRVAKRSIVFVISDFIADDFEKALKKTLFDKEVIAISCQDRQEEKMSDVGLVWTQDSESDSLVLVNTASKKITSGLQQRLQDQKKILKKSGVDLLSLKAQGQFMHELIMFFQKRMM
ncbi:MAG: DUF58 domain-containing protein [Candidatus Dependentiae bacterium]|nr:DUF58 domain-containing protein [Candidatus Dependentiae bacterium]